MAGKEKEVFLLDSHNHEYVKNYENNEKDKEELIENSRGRSSGRHISTKAEAEAYLRDLTDFPNVAALYAADALLRALRNQRRTGKKRKKNEMIKDGRINAALPSQATNAAGGCVENMFLPGEQTEPAIEVNALKNGVEGSADAGCSNLDAVEGTANETPKVAKENAFINILENGEQSGINAAMGRRLSSGAELLDRKDVVPAKLLRAPRYFDPVYISQKTCYKCGEDNHIPANCVAPKKKKPCFICGCLGHNGKHCNKVNKCFFCSERSHLAKDCPKKDIVSEHISYFCLRCGDSGHNMFSCSNNYFPDDLERIPCLVCKTFGHVCCVNISNEGPTLVSCYSCGQSGHLGSECVKVHDSDEDMETTLLDHKNGVEGSKPKKRKKHKKAKELGATSLGIVSRGGG